MPPSPAPLSPPPRRRGFPVRQPRLTQLSLPGLLHAAETHPDIDPIERHALLVVRERVASRLLRGRALDAEVVR